MRLLRECSNLQIWKLFYNLSLILLRWRRKNSFKEVSNCPEALGGKWSVRVIVYISEEHGPLHLFCFSYFRKHKLFLTSLTASGAAAVGSGINSLCLCVLYFSKGLCVLYFSKLIRSKRLKQSIRKGIMCCGGILCVAHNVVTILPGWWNIYSFKN